MHGIGGPRDPAAELELWLGALAVGAGAAGHARHAPELRRGTLADVRFAYYGDLFAAPQAQGVGELEEAEAFDVRSLLREVIDARLAECCRTDGETRVLQHAQAQLAPEGPAQGLGSAARQVLSAANTLLAVPGLRTFGAWASGRLMVGHLTQVTRYLASEEGSDAGPSLAARVRDRVAQALDPAVPTVVVAHSLGTVVALETLSSHRGDVPLFMTLGSPLGLRAIVGRRVRPQPPRAPDAVSHWVNVWDRDDLIVGRARLEDFVGANVRSVLPVTRRVDSDGAWVHSALKYLAHPGVAGPIVEALDVVTQS
ncbi:alpha/beta hydrolase [Streptomyces sp. NPDC050743]|uniref:alpha/beta hydrolase n=1 Tax=Streptomyces sp. NPDC050743 TaxID=3365634 RepID=UPI003796004D